MAATQEAVSNAKQLGISLDKLELIEKTMSKWVSDGMTPTIVALANRKGVPIYKGIYGTSGIDVPLSENSIFPVASVTKPVIATLMFILQEDGLIDMAEQVKLYLPEFDRAGWCDITIWHFLTHTSGLDEGEMGEFFRKYIKEKYDMEEPADGSTNEEWDEFNEKLYNAMGFPECDDNDERYQRIDDKITYEMTIPRKPHEKMSYNNFGYNICRKIIEKVSKKTVDEFAAERLFVPLGMNDSYWLLPKEKWNRVVKRGDDCTGSGWLNSERCLMNNHGGGGLKSTAADIMRLLEMVRQNGTLDGVRILSPASIRVMTSNHNGDMASVYDSWALGWNYCSTKKDDTGVLRSPSCIDHGGFGGIKIVYDREYDITYALFTVERESIGWGYFFSRFTNMLLSSLD